MAAGSITNGAYGRISGAAQPSATVHWIVSMWSLNLSPNASVGSKAGRCLGALVRVVVRSDRCVRGGTVSVRSESVRGVAHVRRGEGDDGAHGGDCQDS